MPQNPPAKPTQFSTAKSTRKPYVAPMLEDYGTVRELTRTGATYYAYLTDITTYYTSSIG